MIVERGYAYDAAMRRVYGISLLDDCLLTWELRRILAYVDDLDGRGVPGFDRMVAADLLETTAGLGYSFAAVHRAEDAGPLPEFEPLIRPWAPRPPRAKAREVEVGSREFFDFFA